MIVVQAGDAVIGGTIKDPMKTYGPAGTALLNLVAVIWLIQAVRKATTKNRSKAALVGRLVLIRQ
jgi:hypothetical protein